MESPEPEIAPQDRQSIDRAVDLLVRLLTTAVAEKRHGTTGLRVSIHDGIIRTYHETTDFSMK